MKKVITIILAFILMTGITCVCAENNDISIQSIKVQDYGSCGEANWALLYGGELEIRGTGRMDNYISFSNTPWYKYADEITKVTVKNGITYIGNFAFSSSNVLSCTIAEGVNEIGESAFADCKSLHQVDMPFGMDSIGRAAFRNCTALEEIHIPHGITEIQDNTFYNCTALAAIYLPDTLGMIKNSVFYGCTNLSKTHFGGTEDYFYYTLNVGGNNDPLFDSVIECEYKEEAPTYTITYNAYDTSVPSQQKKYGESINITDVAPKKTNYEFAGWSVSGYDGTVDFVSGAEYSANADLTLYAIWTKKLYAVTSSLPSGAYFNSGVSNRRFYLSCENEDADIYYTTDESDPTTQDTLYDGGWITLSQSMTLKAAAYLDGELFSDIAEYKYIYDTNLYIVEKATFGNVKVVIGDDLTKALPKTTTLKTSNNDTITVSVDWDIGNNNTNTEGSFMLKGTVTPQDSKYVWFDEAYKNADITVIVSQKAAAPDDDAVYGDVNIDGKVDMKDTTRLLRHLSGWEVELGVK